MRVTLLQIDGKLPNIAIMHMAYEFRKAGRDVSFRRGDHVSRVSHPILSRSEVYASGIFRRSLPIVEALFGKHKHSILGGTAVDPARKNEVVPLSPVIQGKVTTLRSLGMEEDGPLDYSIYPNFSQSMGFTQRGCRLSCEFCVVPDKEGRVREVADISSIWRGDPWPREVILLDNDFFGQPHWRQRIEELRAGNFKVSFNQGINCRCLTDDAAQAIASVDYRDDSMSVKRIYTAWDNRADEERLFTGLKRLVKYGVKPDHIMVYMLVGYWPGEKMTDCLYRQSRLREFGCRPYPMPYVRNKETVGFQRWVIGAYDKRFTWDQWVAADNRPEKLGNAAFN